MRKFIHSYGCRISYLEHNPDKQPTIFFLHGNSGSAQTWNNQLQDSIFSPYQLIAFDLPGHGTSEEPEDTENGYNLCALGKTMAGAINQLAGSSSYILVGFSLGTNILGEVITQHVKPQGIVLISPCVLRTIEDLSIIFLENQNSAYFFSQNITNAQLEALANDCFYTNNASAQNIFKNDFLNTSTSFRPMLTKGASEGNYTNEIKTLTEYNKQILVVFGKQDKIVNTDYLDMTELPLWHRSITKLDQAGHFVHVDAAKAVSELITTYATEIFKSAHASSHNV